MIFDIYGNRLARGHCEVHPHVHQEYPCDLCLSQRSPKQRAPDGPMCGICGKHEACADSRGVAVCSEACDHEARRRHDEPEALRTRLAALEDEKNTYIDYVGDALGQDHDGESLWDAAQRVLSERDKLRAELAAAKADAERYRELRRLATTWPTTALVVNYNTGHDWRTADVPDEIDSVVDGAIAARGAA